MLLLALGLASCGEEGAFGMSGGNLTRRLKAGELEPFLKLSEGELADTGSWGPAAYYYLGRWVELHLPALPAPESTAASQAAPSAPAEATATAPANSEAAPLPTTAEAPGASIPPLQPPADPARAQALDFARRLYGLALARATGIPREEAARALLRLDGEAARSALPDSPESAAAWARAVEDAALVARTLTPSLEAARLRLGGFEALGRPAELLAEAKAARTAFSADARYDEAEILYYETRGALDLGKPEALTTAQKLLGRPASDWTQRILSLGDEGKAPALGSLSPALIGAARLKLAIKGRDYGAAARALPSIQPLLTVKEADPALLAEACKAYLYGPNPAEGLGFIDGLPQAVRQGPAAWTLAFYRARCLRALERWDEAATAFFALIAGAPRSADADAARYYAAESGIKRAQALAATEGAGGPEAARRSALNALAAVAAEWKNPAEFYDLADPLLREGIQARDWPFVDEFARRLGERLSPVLASRALYVSARAIELGYLDSTAGAATDAATQPSPEATARYQAILDRAGAATYYRILAAARLGQALPLLPTEAVPAAVSGSAAGAAASGTTASASAASAYLAGFLGFSLPELVYPEARPRMRELGPEEIRALAARMAEEGLVADSMRFILALLRRSDVLPRRSDYELLYPRAYREEFRDARRRLPSPDYVLYGLVRSESFFLSDVVSRAGAVGLSQLMPATAAETARAIGLGSYDLRSPADNLLIGFSHFGELLAETGGRQLHAMFAYNAGRTRLRRWLGESGKLPDDLLLEALTIEETRQYGRNILEAAAYYGELYYGKSSAEVAKEILGEEAGEGRRGE